VTLDGPLFSIVTPVYNTEIGVLRETIESVVEQTFQDWELILVDDASPNDEVRQVLRAAADKDSRVRVIERSENGHIVAASNDGIGAARAPFIGLLDHDDLLVPEALERVRAAIEFAPDADYFYSDEDKIDEDGRFYDHFRKPGWSPERLRGQMYTCHFSVLRTSLVREVGGFHEGFDGSQDHDLVLRVTERARRVVHIPEVLYHWRVVPGSAAGVADAKPYAWVAGRKAVQEHVDRIGIEADVDYGPVTGTYALRRSLDPDVRVSVIIPTRGGTGLVWGEPRCFVVEAVRSVLDRGGHSNVELVIVHDRDTPESVLDELRGLGGDDLVLVPYDKKFNFSEKCNVGAIASTGDVVVLLNDDIELAADDSLVQLVAPLVEEGVGMTGARLHFSDGRFQHAGLAFYGQHFHHMFYRYLGEDPGPFAALTVNRECSGLTGAWVALKRSTFFEVGGLTEALPINFNDVDFSLKVAHLGLRLVWVASARAYHFESQTRVAVVDDWEREFVHARWDIPAQDLYMPDFGAPRRSRGKSGRRGVPTAK
jgi:glycosyltransferase involved in cell wall biosynthesis